MAGKKLLVADDSLTIQKVIRLALSNEGYEIQAVSDGNDAVQQISLFRPDVVLIDVSLPSKSAFEVKRAINELEDLEEVRFVLMSSAFEKVDEPQADEVKFHGRLTKPFDPAHLRQVLTEVLNQVTSKRQEPTLNLEVHGDNEPENEEEEEDWLKPVTSGEPIMAPPPPVGEVAQLWDGDSINLSGTSTDSDIKHLTESTIRMSGLDDFQWSVSEPSLKPPASMMEGDGPNFQIEPPQSGDTDSLPPFRPEFTPEILGVTEASPDPIGNEMPSIESISTPRSDLGNASSPSDFYRDATAEATKRITTSLPPLPLMGASAEVVAVSQQQMEELIRKEIQQLLPQIAEKLIKAEIHRMLSES